MKRLGQSVLAVALLASAACAPVMSQHGYAPPDAELAGIAVGEDTRGSVRRKIGRPSVTGLFTNDGWYYVSTEIERMAYNEPRVTDRRVVAIKFDARDVVASLNVYGLEDGKVVDLQTRTTPTYGRELTILQQLFGNLGALSADQLLDQ